MNEKIPIQDIIERLSAQAGITKKMSAEILRALPAIIEEGLQKDGEARVKGLGTFRLKQVKGKIGRNPKTGERVEIPGHNRVVFLPEQSLKEYISQLDKPFEYKVIEEKTPDDTIASATAYVPDEPPRPATFREIEPETTTLEPVYTQPPEPPEVPQEPEFKSRRRIHWIIPVMFGLVIILALIFYFRNCRPVEETRQEETGIQKTEDKSQESTTSPPGPLSESERGNRGPGGQGGEAETDTVSGNEPETSNQEQNKLVPELKPQNLNLNTATVGSHLFQLAREVYGNPFLWVLIYRANQDKIKDPDLAVTGENIVIPGLEGTPKKLTHNDSLNVSDGYRLVYEFYLSKGDVRAEEFRQVMEKYKPD